MGHPAHFYNYKNVIPALKEHGHEVEVLIKKKDILQDLLKNAGIEYHNILPEGRTDSKYGILKGLVKRAIRTNSFCSKYHPDILTGSSVENSFIGKFRSIPVINIGEDDASAVPLYAKLSYPWSDVILVPTVCNCGKWDNVAIKYHSYHELAYLHPNHFTPNKSIVENYFSADEPYFIIRFSKLNAHHDSGIKGINAIIAENIIKILKPHGRIFITSERELEPQFEKYRIHINPLDMHHILAYADIYIGDSQTMAAEAGVLGTPFVRYNDFVGRIGYLRDLENNYHLGYGVKTNEEMKLYEVIDKLLKMPNRKDIFGERRRKMLSEKIDYAKFLTWFIENYPKSKEIVLSNPTFEYNFK